MKNLLYLMAFAIILSFTMCQKDPTLKQVEKTSTLKATYLINNSKIALVQKNAIVTTTVNMLQMLATYYVNSSTLIYLNGIPTTLDKLKAGYKVTVYYTSNVAIKIYASNTSLIQ
jgi:hypothetical protein